MRLKQVAFFVVVAISLVAYPLLLLPYLVHHNLPNAGLVLSSESIKTTELPQAIQSYLKSDSDMYYLILRQKSPVRTDQPYTDWIIAVITPRPFEPGKLVEFADPKADFFVDWRDYPFGRSFNELVVADVVQEVSGIEAYVERPIYDPYGGPLLILSTADYYAGSLIFILLCLSLPRRLSFWSILLSVWGYAFGQQLYNYFALVHHNYIPDELKLFGFTSFVWAAGAFLLWIYETRTAHGRRVTETVFHLG
jgi:hypothetical protein